MSRTVEPHNDYFHGQFLLDLRLPGGCWVGAGWVRVPGGCQETLSLRDKRLIQLPAVSDAAYNVYDVYMMCMMVWCECVYCV